MFRDTIKGLELVFENDPPKGQVVLIIGEPGTLKSAFVYNVMSNYLSSHPNESGIYMMLEEKKDSHVRNMTSLGIKHSPGLQVCDFASLRTELESSKGSGKEKPTPSDYVISYWTGYGRYPPGLPILRRREIRRQ